MVVVNFLRNEILAQWFILRDTVSDYHISPSALSTVFFKVAQNVTLRMPFTFVTNWRSKKRQTYPCLPVHPIMCSQLMDDFVHLIQWISHWIIYATHGCVYLFNSRGPSQMSPYRPKKAHNHGAISIGWPAKNAWTKCTLSGYITLPTGSL